ncbi:MAG: MurR/RpiR family transcriptional regulator [Lachnospiraceae bacterium]|nr:MurR/RpiR family transcriptional regulator [Lachnospiraceae bacterium]
MEKSNSELINRIDEHRDSFSKGQRKLAEYIEMHYDKAVFLTAAKLGKAVGVSESTVVRFAMELGYDGYPKFQTALEDYVRQKLNTIQRIELASGIMSEAGVIDTVLQSDAEKIKVTLDMINKNAFDEAVATILKAKTVYIIGIRSCAPLASFLAFYMNLVCDDVRILQTTNSSELFEQMIKISEKDVIIGISFPRYSMRTLKALEFANNRNAKVITITDGDHSPMTLYSSCNLFAKSDMVSIVDSLVAPLSLINALIVSLCMKKKNTVMKTLEEMEQIWDEYQIYNNDEINRISNRIDI